jgi:hypothetical protein
MAYESQPSCNVISPERLQLAAHNGFRAPAGRRLIRESALLCRSLTLDLTHSPCHLSGEAPACLSLLNVEGFMTLLQLDIAARPECLKRHPSERLLIINGRGCQHKIWKNSMGTEQVKMATCNWACAFPRGT